MSDACHTWLNLTIAWVMTAGGHGTGFCSEFAT